MNPDSSKLLPNTEQLFRLHDQASAAFRAELAQRSAAVVLYDDFLLAQMRKGKPFKVALRKANARFPAQALTPSSADFADTEAHYQYFLDLETMDEYRRRLEENERQIEENERKIAALQEAIANHQHSVG
jgi:hypothetical protein